MDLRSWLTANLLLRRSLLVAQELINTKVIILIHHTDCVSPGSYISQVLVLAGPQEMEGSCCVHLRRARRRRQSTMTG